MADFWVSQKKKECEYCKCWIADNRPSIDFHERGKNHKENVKKRLADLRKNTTLKRKQDEEFKSDFAKMEAAALAAMKKDAKINPSLIGSSDARTLLSLKAKKENENKTSSTTATSASSGSNSTYGNESKATTWEKLTAVQGHSYYYNKQTGESRWKKPKEYKEEDNLDDPPSKVNKILKPNSSSNDPKNTLLGAWVTTVEDVSTEEQLQQGDIATSSEAIEQQTLQHETPPAFSKKFKEKVLCDASENNGDSELCTTNIEFKKRKLNKRKLRTRNAVNE